ncbi:PD-(D/E)XK nuclease domain-containing protein [Candidatus Dependentiae bacterium]|nr:PD-(D/E)XK nuclease domain-containing protein [Candidatus Dependentiae bacterium]
MTLSDVYEVISNRESGYGRYDIMLVPKDVKKRGIVIEFKRVAEKESLEQATKACRRTNSRKTVCA